MKTENKAVQPANDPKTGRIDKGPQGITFKSLDPTWDKYACSLSGAAKTLWFNTYAEAKAAFDEKAEPMSTLNKTKLITWSYPTSSNAKKFKFTATGCWSVETQEGIRPPVALRGFASRDEALSFARSLNVPSECRAHKCLSRTFTATDKTSGRRRQALIAAAPETKAQRDQLLAACKAALGAIESGDPSMSERSMLIAAIARAEGKEQAQ